MLFRSPERIIGPRPTQAQQAFDQVKDIMREITEIREGHLPKTGEGGQPMAVLTALMAFKTSTEGQLLEPEKKGLLDTRIAMLRLELLNKTAETQTMGQVAEEMRDVRTQLQGAFGTPAGAAPGPVPTPGMGPGGPAVQGNAPGQVVGNAEATQTEQPPVAG